MLIKYTGNVWLHLCRYLWSQTLSWGVDRGGEEEELDDLLLHSEDKGFINLT